MQLIQQLVSGYLQHLDMKKFLEIEEQQTQDEIDLGIPQQIIRIDVTDKTDKEIDLIRQKFEPLIKNPKSFLHNCFHDEGKGKQCERKELGKLSI
jgi:hypothetical protein